MFPPAVAAQSVEIRNGFLLCFFAYGAVYCGRFLGNVFFFGFAGTFEKPAQRAFVFEHGVDTFKLVTQISRVVSCYCSLHVSAEPLNGYPWELVHSAAGRFPPGWQNLIPPSANTHWQITFEPVRLLLCKLHDCGRLGPIAQHCQICLGLLA